MIFLSDFQKKIIGFDFILDKLSLSSCYGKDKIKKIRPYEIEDKDLLILELSNIKIIIDNYDEFKGEFQALQSYFKKLRNIRGSLKKIEHYPLDEVELFEIKSFLFINEDIFDIFKKIKHLNLFNINFLSLKEALDILDIDKRRVASFYISELYSDRLKKIRALKRDIEDAIILNRHSSKVDELRNRRHKIVNLEEEEELKVKEEIAKKLRPYLEVFKKNIESMANFDLIFAKANLAKEYDCTYPNINDSNMVYFKDVYNPEVYEILKSRNRKFTPLTIELKRGTTFLTGANMGGKSVAIKTFVLNIFLLHMGFFVFAKEASICMFQHIHLISEDMQSISTGLSTFGAEIIKFNEIINDVNHGFAFVCLDEFARGTNPHEGAIIVKSIGEYLNSKLSITLMSTHYDNVADEKFNHYQVAGLKNSEFKKNKKLNPEDYLNLISQYMDYKIIKIENNESVPKDALNICRLLGLSSDILCAIEENYIKGDINEFK